MECLKYDKGMGGGGRMNRQVGETPEKEEKEKEEAGLCVCVCVCWALLPRSMCSQAAE